MKKLLTNLTLIAVAVLMGGALGSCTKEGPAGPSGTAQCGQCHSSTTFLLAKENQWAVSLHATGGLEVRNTSQCAICHTSEGYVENLATQADSTVATVNNPTPQNCRTCHYIHTNYDSTDFKRRGTDPFTLMATGHVTSVDFGEGNLCARCHQARPVSAPDLPAINATGTLTVSNSHWGPHHSPIAQILAGVGGFEVDGGAAKASSPHYSGVKNTCVNCHMETVMNDITGGHTLWMTNGTTVNMTSCADASCHGTSPFSGAKTFEAIPAVQTYMADLGQLRALLAGKGMIDTTKSNGDFLADAEVPGTYPAVDVGILYNYLLLTADKSMGIHNMKYSTYLVDISKSHLQ